MRGPASRLLCRLAGRRGAFSGHGEYQRFAEDAPRFSRVHLQLAGGCAVLATGVYVTHLEPVPITGRSHLVLCSVATERALGDQAHAQVLAQFRDRILPPLAPASRRVARVGNRIVEAVTADARLKRLPWLKDAKWSFTVVDSDQVNAFVVPGGKVVVFTGLLRLFPNDDELAVVLAHEIGHTVARHTAEKVSASLITTLLSLALALATGADARVSSALVDVGLSLPFSRRAETEADAIGVELAAAACYDPRAAPRVFAALGAATEGRGKPPAWLSTHPADAERVKAMRAALPKAEAAADTAGCADRQSAFGHFH